MSGNSYDATCPKCGGIMYCYNDYKPFEFVSGDCVDCGFSYETKESQLSLEDVNDVRNTMDLKPINKLKKQISNF